MTVAKQIRALIAKNQSMADHGAKYPQGLIGLEPVGRQTAYRECLAIIEAEDAKRSQAIKAMVEAAMRSDEIDLRQKAAVSKLIEVVEAAMRSRSNSYIAKNGREVTINDANGDPMSLIGAGHIGRIAHALVTAKNEFAETNGKPHPHEWHPMSTAPRDGAHILAVLVRESCEDMDGIRRRAFSEVREIFYRPYVNFGMSLPWHAGDPIDSHDGFAPEHMGEGIPVLWRPVPRHNLGGRR